MIYAPTQFLEQVMALSGLFGFRITSYYRSPQANASVGGVSDSLHQLWLAADVVLDEMTETNMADFVRGAGRLGLHAIIEDDHIHLQPPKEGRYVPPRST